MSLSADTSKACKLTKSKSLVVVTQVGNHLWYDTRPEEKMVIMLAMAQHAALWGKRDDMIVRGRLPYNAEPPAPALASGDITPIDTFYARNHGPFPDISPRRWRLRIDGRVDEPLTLTYDRLIN